MTHETDSSTSVFVPQSNLNQNALQTTTNYLESSNHNQHDFNAELSNGFSVHSRSSISLDQMVIQTSSKYQSRRSS